MPGIGVLTNIGAVLLGTAIGLAFGKLIGERFHAIAFSAMGLAVMLIGLSMALGGLADLGDTAVGSYAALVLVGCLVVGSLLGEALKIEYWLERFGLWLQAKVGKAPMLVPTEGAGAEDDETDGGHTLVEGFVTASLLFCTGAMTVLGSLQDGLGDPSLLMLKSLLDGTAAVALATALGAGVGLSVIPILVLQGGIALGASALEPFITPAVIAAIEAVGGALILAIGLDLVKIKRLPVGNMLPAVFLAAAVGYLLG
jgi:uncharacterized membrane protein YqgA involved in biofilm formation